MSEQQKDLFEQHPTPWSIRWEQGAVAKLAYAIDANKKEINQHTLAIVAVALVNQQAAVERLVETSKELQEVATLRGDNKLPPPADDRRPWTARMQTAWNEHAAALAAFQPQHQPQSAEEVAEVDCWRCKGKGYYLNLLAGKTESCKCEICLGTGKVSKKERK